MTRLKALELFGFKSFADRTRFEFHSGITAIVGPNGSGKSNVVDAIKWVLGEQSVRSLRGKEMTDVIFAGAATRRPLNAAETTLVFDNTAGELPLSSDEVRIGRRVYRSGESEYLINGEISRLRDIRELFSGTGAATEAYSVIEQGRVDALLVASGRERRAVFEEAAGITRFRVRRAEALRRLERTEQNRQRLADIVGEVAARLETVLRQAARARRWRVLSDRLKRCRLTAAAHDLSGVEAERAEVEQIRAGLTESRHAVREQLTLLEQRLLETGEQLQQLDRQTETSDDRVADARQAVAAAEATLGQLESRRRESADDLSLAVERVAARAREEQAEAVAEAAACERLAAAEARCGEIRSEMESLRTTAEGSLVDAEAAREAATRLENDVTLGHRRHLELQVELQKIEHLSAAAVERSVDRRQQLEAVIAQRARLAESRAACEGNIDALENLLRDQLAEVERLEQAESSLSAAITAAWDDLTRLRGQLAACRERERVLEELAARHEGVPAGVQALLADGSDGPAGLDGLLADAVTADAAIAPLVDLALGRLGPSLLIGRLEEAVTWAASPDRPASCCTGPLGFVAIDTPPSKGVVHDDVAPSATGIAMTDLPGVIGRLDRLVHCAARHATVVQRILGRFWVVESLDDAVRLLPTVDPDVTLCTRDGALLSPRGVLETGAAGLTGLVARQSEKAVLADRDRELRAVVQAAEQTLAARETDRGRTREALRGSRGRVEQTKGELATSRAEMQRIVRDQSSLARSIELADEACREADRDAASRLDAVERLRECVSAAAENETQLAGALAKIRRTIQDFDRSRGSLLEEMNGLTTARDTAERERLEAQDEVRRLAVSRSAARSASADERKRLADVRRRAGCLELECLRTRQTHAEAAIIAERAARERCRLHTERDATLAAQREAAAAARTAQEQLADLERQDHAAELALGDARHRRSRIVERIREDYGLEIDVDVTALTTAADDAVAGADEDEPLPNDRELLEEEIERLRKKLGSMSTVNLEALSEAEELEKRHGDLQAQLADVTSAKSSIEQLISRIDDESRRLLGETIETVRGHFRDLFERLFAGGQADIVIDPAEDLLEASVEIVARPPGKEPRSISLLSGGEKTMTCVALLLAIFKSRPSPFCVLDEVDAALDEANVDRLASVLRDFMSSTQFIVVTHSKKTMAAATTLYGITQEESGISKRVSVRFEETAARMSRAA